MGTREAKLLIHLLRACPSWRVCVFCFFNDLVMIRVGTANDHNAWYILPRGWFLNHTKSCRETESNFFSGHGRALVSGRECSLTV